VDWGKVLAQKSAQEQEKVTFFGLKMGCDIAKVFLISALLTVSPSDFLIGNDDRNQSQLFFLSF
jgi:hypothetical protein